MDGKIMSRVLVTSEAAKNIWEQLLAEADEICMTDSAISPILCRFISENFDYDDALCNLIGHTLSSEYTKLIDLKQLVHMAIMSNPTISLNGIEDLTVFLERDPACQSLLEVFLFYKGYRVLQAYRVAHHYWQIGKKELARLFQSVISDKFSMDIHPGARLDGGIFIDHGTGITIGETSVIQRNVSILHDVTLGGTGKDCKDRHPKIEEGVLIGAGAKVLGNITVGSNSKIAAGSIVLENVPPNVTVVGIPARIVSIHKKGSIPAYHMMQDLK
jgi:serine O-acetyltransferase